MINIQAWDVYVIYVSVQANSRSLFKSMYIAELLSLNRSEQTQNLI